MTVKKGTEQFIEESKKKFGDKFDYSKVDYISSKQGVIIMCPTHGELTQAPANHLKSKYGCEKCAINDNKGTKTQFKLKVVCPQLEAEYIGEKPFGELILGSHYNAKWKCIECTHEWFCAVKNRSNNGTGCPKCASKVADDFNNFKVLYPELMKEWDPDQNTVFPDSLLPNSHAVVYWVCQKSPVYHKWSTQLHARTKSGNGCPYCHGTYVAVDTSLAYKCPKIAAEWHPTKNGDKLPTNFTWSSGARVFWQCNKGHEWDTTINTRTSRYTNCPSCAEMRAYSQIGIDWVESISEETGLDIQHATNGNGEFYIQGIKTRVDGFCASTNTVYEFHGCYWHYHECQKTAPDEIHPHCDVPNIVLREKTLAREEAIKALGYNLVTIYECVYKASKK